jgi:hypothetical protein
VLLAKPTEPTAPRFRQLPAVAVLPVEPALIVAPLPRPRNRLKAGVLLPDPDSVLLAIVAELVALKTLIAVATPVLLLETALMVLPVIVALLVLTSAMPFELLTPS